MAGKSGLDNDLLRRWVETWRRAGPQLESVRRADMESAGARQAVHQIFDGLDRRFFGPPRPTSGLVEQQFWFAKLRLARGPR